MRAQLATPPPRPHAPSRPKRTHESAFGQVNSLNNPNEQIGTAQEQSPDVSHAISLSDMKHATHHGENLNSAWGKGARKGLDGRLDGIDDLNDDVK